MTWRLLPGSAGPKFDPSSPPISSRPTETPQMEILLQEPHSQVKSGFDHWGYSATSGATLPSATLYEGRNRGWGQRIDSDTQEPGPLSTGYTLGTAQCQGTPTCLSLTVDF